MLQAANFKSVQSDFSLWIPPGYQVTRPDTLELLGRFCDEEVNLRDVGQSDNLKLGKEKVTKESPNNGFRILTCRDLPTTNLKGK